MRVRRLLNIISNLEQEIKKLKNPIIPDVKDEVNVILETQENSFLVKKSKIKKIT